MNQSVDKNIVNSPSLGRKSTKPRVFVAMSGGVDSSVTATLLKEQGYDLTGVYMKNWTKDLPGMRCPWKEDVADAKRVALQIGIPFEIFDFQDEYKQKVVDYMIDSFKQGLTPNPDIMCNQEIKFKLFLETALERGADLIATGHYAKIARDSEESSDSAQLHIAKDTAKDQTYFLYRISKEALGKTLMPIGDYTKPEIRELARRYKLPTANKKDSMGVCFVGEVGIKEFLSQYVTTKPGPIIDSNGAEIGEHEGAIFYTIGQRHGLKIGGGLPYYVCDKDMQTNAVYVTQDLNDKKLWDDTIRLTATHWIDVVPEINKKYKVRIRHQGELIGCSLKDVNGNSAVLKLEKEVRALTPGQSAVVYSGTCVVGGGIIAS